MPVALLFQAYSQPATLTENHDIRLLETQIAKGGIIDPVHSHLVPVDMAYQPGYFDGKTLRFSSTPTHMKTSCSCWSAVWRTLRRRPASPERWRDGVHRYRGP
ncbi:hypothetical protein A6R68_07406 [Neotoma lepida]|uniref:Uncharacterized protein n=1 Tax=Neotoma lepida TaxID=56216 RepID=A0A1A6GDX4_NEOLE|nr:hypothetical protein A6R68_07406 [Neotoma lepida]